MKIELKEPNYKLSPFSGLSRKHWVEAGKYLLQGIFSSVKDCNQPIIVDRQDFQITYPHLSASIEIQEYKKS